MAELPLRGQITLATQVVDSRDDDRGDVGGRGGGSGTIRHAARTLGLRALHSVSSDRMSAGIAA